MENKTEDEIRKRWEIEAKERTEREEEAQQRPKKRARAIEYNMENDELESLLDAITIQTLRPKLKPKKKATARKVSTRAKNSISEIMEENEVVELD
jgi:anti-sigma factor RsiW